MWPGSETDPKRDPALVWANPPSRPRTFFTQTRWRWLLFLNGGPNQPKPALSKLSGASSESAFSGFHS